MPRPGKIAAAFAELNLGLERTHDLQIVVERRQCRAVAVRHSGVLAGCGARNLTIWRKDDEPVRLRRRVDENHSARSVDARLADDVAVVGRGTPVDAHSSQDAIGQFEHRGGVVVHRRCNGSLFVIAALGEDSTGLSPNRVRRPEEVGQLTDHIDAEIGQHPPMRLLHVEEPGRMLGAAMRQDRIGHAHPADGAGVDEAFRLLDRRAAVKRERHEHLLRSRRSLFDADGVAEGSRHRFLAEHMLPRLERADREIGVGRVGGRDDDSFDVARPQHRVEVRVDGPAILLRERLTDGGSPGVQPAERKARAASDHRNEARARDVAAAYHSNSNRRHPHILSKRAISSARPARLSRNGPSGSPRRGWPSSRD